jgi:hypothetical protein
MMLRKWLSSYFVLIAGAAFHAGCVNDLPSGGG